MRPWRAVLRATHSPLPFQGEASVGSSSTRHVANAAAGRSKHAAREIRNYKQAPAVPERVFTRRTKTDISSISHVYRDLQMSNKNLLVSYLAASNIRSL